MKKAKKTKIDLDTDFEYLEHYHIHGGTYELPVEIVNTLTYRIEELVTVINDIKRIVDNEKISGIESKLIIKDILE